MGHKVKHKDDYRVLGLSNWKVKGCHLQEALPDYFGHPVPLRADPRSPQTFS